MDTTTPSDWRDEEWAQKTAALDTTERTRRINAATVLLANPDEISDPLESELLVLLDALRGTDLSAIPKP